MLVLDNNKSGSVILYALELVGVFIGPSIEQRSIYSSQVV